MTLIKQHTPTPEERVKLVLAADDVRQARTMAAIYPKDHKHAKAFREAMQRFLRLKRAVWNE